MRLHHPAIREEKVPPLVWFLAVAVIVLGASVAVGGLYLNARRSVLDTHQQQTRQAICTILNALPPATKLTPPKERIAFAKAYRLERCVRPPAPKPSPSRSPKRERSTPTPRPTATASAPQTRPTPVIVRNSHPIKIRPTVTKTRTAKPKPTHTRSPSPEPTKSCLLGINTTVTCQKK